MVFCTSSADVNLNIFIHGICAEIHTHTDMDTQYDEREEVNIRRRRYHKIERTQLAADSYYGSFGFE